MKRLYRPTSLLGRTTLALGLAFLLFGAFATTLVEFTLVRPHARQAADDLAAFLVLTAQVWVELPPETRTDYERELLQRHELRILQTEAPYPTKSGSHTYLTELERALGRLTGKQVHIHRHPDFNRWLWADFPMGGRVMRLGFKEDRLQQQALLVLPFLAVIGVFIAFVLSVLLVRRITRPLATMAEATTRIGGGDFSASIPETGPQEIAHLAGKLNHMESQIRQLIENRTTLLAGISHDLRTPLARMRLELELLAGHAKPTLIDGLHKDIAEMERLIAQILMLAKGLDPEEARCVDIGELLEEITGDFRKTGADIQLRPCRQCERVVSANALKRVISNLVENAVRYGEGKPITLECVCSQAAVEVHVVDCGPGIPVDERQAVFEPFHRLETSRSKMTGGSGLGLAIVRQLCQANGWSIDTVSPPQGGASFVVRLPNPPASSP